MISHERSLSRRALISSKFALDVETFGNTDANSAPWKYIVQRPQVAKDWQTNGGTQIRTEPEHSIAVTKG